MLLCWLAAFVARLSEMVVISSRVFNVLYFRFVWETVGCGLIEAITAVSTAAVF